MKHLVIALIMMSCVSCTEKSDINTEQNTRDVHSVPAFEEEEYKKQHYGLLIKNHSNEIATLYLTHEGTSDTSLFYIPACSKPGCTSFISKNFYVTDTSIHKKFLRTYFKVKLREKWGQWNEVPVKYGEGSMFELY